MKLVADRGGKGSRLLVLLHGLGATKEVWRKFIAEDRWNGRWIAPDLRGHGASPHAEDYSLDAHAADVAELVDHPGETIIVGHSMGGAIALALASGAFGFRPSRVFGLGIKVAWNDDERAGMRKLAETPARVLASRDEAVSRYLKVSGLARLVAPDSPEALAGVVRASDGWRLAGDPRAATVGPPPMQALLDAAETPIHLARGENDTLVTHAQLTQYDPAARDIPGGHNAMVEHPRGVRDWIESFWA